MLADLRSKFSWKQGNQKIYEQTAQPHSALGVCKGIFAVSVVAFHQGQKGTGEVRTKVLEAEVPETSKTEELSSD